MAKSPKSARIAPTSSTWWRRCPKGVKGKKPRFSHRKVSRKRAPARKTAPVVLVYIKENKDRGGQCAVDMGGRSRGKAAPRLRKRWQLVDWPAVRQGTPREETNSFF
jgi:hypothetical protein